MPREQDIPFLEIIKETFGSVFEEYSFESPTEAKWNGAGEYVITVRKGDIVLNFYLGVSPMFYHCSVGLRLTGKLGERATPDPKYRNMGVGVIAECLNPEYKSSRKGAQTSEEVKREFEICRAELLNYCKDILSGDVSSWSTVVKRLKKK